MGRRARDRQQPRRRTGATLALLLALVAAGCAGDDGTDGVEVAATATDGETGGPTEAATDAATEPTAKPTATTTEPTTTDDGPVTTGGDAGCIEGSWSLRGEAFAEQMTAGFGDATAAEAEFVGGEFLVEMRDDGTFSATREDWSIRLVMPEGAFRMTFTGSETGTWTLTDEGLDVTNDPSSDPDVELAIENPDGTLTPLPSTGVGPSSEMANAEINAIRTGLTVDCDGDVLTLTSDDESGFVSVLDRR